MTWSNSVGQFIFGWDLSLRLKLSLIVVNGAFKLLIMLLQQVKMHVSFSLFWTTFRHFDRMLMWLTAYFPGGISDSGWYKTFIRLQNHNNQAVQLEEVCGFVKICFCSHRYIALNIPKCFAQVPLSSQKVSCKPGGIYSIRILCSWKYSCGVRADDSISIVFEIILDEYVDFWLKAFGVYQKRVIDGHK